MNKIELSTSAAFEKAGVRSVLVAVSGGADSVALLCACARIAPRLGVHVEAAHCNFHLRGAESDRDSTFTESLCMRLGIRLHKLDYDVEAHMNEHPGISTEMACRELRYSDFFRICREKGLDRVAVAHNADDDIETMILALLRGSGTRGLRGMDADNGRIIRPLLGISRKEIESYLKAIGQDFITDSSNLSSDYRRNFIRREVLPLLESRWPGARKSLSRSLGIIKEDAEIVATHFSRQLQSLCKDSTTLFVYEDGVSKGTILRFIEPFGGNPSVAEDISEALMKPFAERKWELDSNHTAVLERDRLSITDNTADDDDMELSWTEIEMTPGVMDDVRSNRNHDIIFLPNGKEAYELRKPETGDRIAPLGMRGTRLISDVISDAKLTREEKAGIRVLVRISDGEIIWIVGLKRSRHDIIFPTTIRVYKAEYSRH